QDYILMVPHVRTFCVYSLIFAVRLPQALAVLRVSSLGSTPTMFSDTRLPSAHFFSSHALAADVGFTKHIACVEIRQRIAATVEQALEADWTTQSNGDIIERLRQRDDLCQAFVINYDVGPSAPPLHFA